MTCPRCGGTRRFPRPDGEGRKHYETETGAKFYEAECDLCENQHDAIVQRIRESLPEFAERNDFKLPDNIMDNLSRWIVSAFPRGVARCTCTGKLPPRGGFGEDIACSCTGACSRWVRVYDGGVNDD